LLEKWNPGVPDYTLSDLMGTVCRWNQLKNADAVQAGQQLLIPTVIPHGQDPPSVTPQRSPGMAAMRPPTPARSNMALSSQLAEQRTRSAVPGGGIWATGGQGGGQHLAGANVKQQFQNTAWNRRG
jgi:hypothetical protein